MLKDLLEKFDKEFDEQFVDESGVNDRSPDDIKSLAHSHIEEAYQSNLERLIEKCEKLAPMFGIEKHSNDWRAGTLATGTVKQIAFGSTPTEAVENLIKALNKQ